MNQINPQTIFGEAAWIGGSHPFDLHEVYFDFISPPINGRGGGSADLFMTADSRYRLWVNGTFIGRGPARCYPWAQAYDQHDLSAVWRTGENQICVQVYQPGYSHFSYVHRGAAGLLATLQVDGVTVCVSNSSWQVRISPVFSRPVPRISIYGSGVEEQDLRLADDWLLQPTATAGGGWEHARPVAEPHGPIWGNLHRRIGKTPVETRQVGTVIEWRVTGANTIPPNVEPHAQAAAAWQQGTPFAPDQTDPEQFQIQLQPNRVMGCLIDLGRSFTCQGSIEIAGALGGETLAMLYAEKKRDGELVISDPATYCRVRSTDRFRLRPGKQTAESFSLRGGRYILLCFSAPHPVNLTITPIVRLLEYPLSLNKRLSLPKSKKLSQIQTLCLTTFKACIQDSFVDCVWRESSQWLGDGYLQAKMLTSLSDETELIRKLLFDTVMGRDELGMVPSVAPGEVHAYTIPRYGCMWIETVVHYANTTADTDFITAPLTRSGPSVWSCLVGLMSYWRHVAPQQDGLFTNPAGRRHYIDWSDSSQNDPHCVVNLHIALAFEQAAQLAQAIDPTFAADWQAAAERLKLRCRSAFFEDGVWYDDLERSTFSQLSAALALLVRAVPAEHIEPMLDAIVARSLNPDDGHQPGRMVLASPFMHHYLFEALTMHGRHQDLIKIIESRWGRWVDQDQPTAWENWNVDFPDGSVCHAFSAHPLFHLQHLLQHLQHQPETNDLVGFENLQGL